MKEILQRLCNYESLTKKQAKEILSNLALGHYNPGQMAAFITIYLMRPITVEELAGFRDAMLDLCIRVPAHHYDAIDLCGTGGDGKDTFNISTLAAFVVAASGQMVAKHGNYGVSSICGSSNVLEYLGVKFSNNPEHIYRSLEEANIAFLHAPLFHPAMKRVAPVRKELGVKTFFNMLGPLVNPAFPKYQMIGVFSLELARLYGYLYQQTDKNFAIVHGLDGYDEVSLTGPFKIISRKGEAVMQPSALGFKLANPASLTGGHTIEEAAKIFLDILQNKGSAAQNSAVLANAGIALSIAKNISYDEGIAMAKESLESGRAFKTFHKFIEITH